MESQKTASLLEQLSILTKQVTRIADSTEKVLELAEKEREAKLEMDEEAWARSKSWAEREGRGSF